MKFFFPNRSPSSTKTRIIWLCNAVIVGVCTLLVLKRPLLVRLGGLLDPFSFNGDALQHIAPMWFLRLPPESVPDYTLRYYLEAILPPLFKAVYWIATIWFTPPAASKIITAILCIVFIATSTLTARRLGGAAAASLTFFLATGGVLKNLPFMGGIQRGFGFCIASIALYLACSGRIVPLAVLAVVAAMLYPAAAVCILTILALLILLKGSHAGTLESWSMFKRMALVFVSALGVGLSVLPQLSGGHAYGTRLSIDAEREFEEWGPHGRYTPGDRGVPINLGHKILSATVSGLSSLKPTRERQRAPDDPELGEVPERTAIGTAMPVIVATVLGGVLILIRRRGALSPEALRCCIFAAGMLIAFSAAKILFPLLYIPSRYVALGTIALIPAIFPAIWALVGRSLVPSHRKYFAEPVALVLGIAAIVSLGWLDVSVKKLPTATGNRVLFAAIRDLPPDAVIASWPRGVASMVPLFTARSVLVFEEGHQIFHQDFLLEMRKRTRAIIAAYAATDITPVKQLRDTYRVSHILLNPRHLTRTPDYFAPFDQEMENARAAVQGQPLILAELAQSKAVFSSKDYILIDIREL